MAVYAPLMLVGLAHTAVCVPDVEEAARWYTEVLGFRLLSPPYRMEGPDIDRDMGELLEPPVVVKAAIVGFGDDDNVLELIEYPGVARSTDHVGDVDVARSGITHVGVVCDDVAGTRAELEQRGVEFVVSGHAELAGLCTTWCRDPWGTVIILMDKRYGDRPYWRQYGG